MVDSQSNYNAHQSTPLCAHTYVQSIPTDSVQGATVSLGERRKVGFPSLLCRSKYNYMHKSESRLVVNEMCDGQDLSRPRQPHPWISIIYMLPQKSKLGVHARPLSLLSLSTIIFMKCEEVVVMMVIFSS